MRPAAGVHEVHTHVWSLGRTNMALMPSPTWAWVAFGPGGTLAGVEVDAETARTAVECARFLVCGEKKS